MDEYKQPQQPTEKQSVPLEEDFDFPLTMDEINAQPEQQVGVNIADTLDNLSKALGEEAEPEPAEKQSVPHEEDFDFPLTMDEINAQPEQQVGVNIADTLDNLSKALGEEAEPEHTADLSQVPAYPERYEGFEPTYSEDRQTKFYQWLKSLVFRAEVQGDMTTLNNTQKKTYNGLISLARDLKTHHEAAMQKSERKDVEHSAPFQHYDYMNSVKEELSELSEIWQKFERRNPRMVDTSEFAPFKREILGVIKVETRVADRELKKMDDVAWNNIQRINANLSRQEKQTDSAEVEPSERSESDINIEPENRNPDSIEQQRARILKCAEELEKAKTLVNSREYKDLIDLMNKVGQNGFKKTEGLSEKEQFAYELSFLDYQVEKYLSHKAADGVKKNALGKLGAVEAASRTISECANLLGNVDLPLNAKTPALPQQLKDINPSLDKRIWSLPGEIIDLAPDRKDDYTAEANHYLEKANLDASHFDAVEQNISDVDSAMCKIVVKALKNGKSATAFEINGLRRDFLKDPFTTLTPEINAEMVQKKADKGPVL